MKKITLEMIDQFIEETGFTFEEARAYLMAAEGDVELAIEAALAKDGNYSRKALDSLVEQVKELVRKGNLVRLVVKKKDEVLVNIPLGVGVFGAVFATFFSAAALGVALMSGHEITLEKQDGKVINVKDYLDKSIKKAKDSGEDLEEYVKKGVKETKEFAKDLKDNIEEKIHVAKDKSKDNLEEAVDKVEEVAEEIKEKVEEKLHSAKDGAEEKLEETKEAVEEIKEEAEKAKKEAKEKAKDVEKKAEKKAEEVKEKTEEVKEEVKEKAKEVKEEVEDK